MSVPTGRASYNGTTKVLKIATLAKRGKKTVEKVEQYDVTSIDADARVALYVYQLSKHSDGVVYEVCVREFGAECNCPHHEFNPNGGACKHVRAMRAVKLIVE